MELKGRLHGQGLTSLQIIASGRVSAESAVSSTDGGVFKQRTVQYLLAAAATFIRAVQMFDETGGTSAGNKRRHGFNVGPLLEFADVLLSKQQSNHPGAAAYKTSRPCTHPILCFYVLHHSVHNSLSKAT